MRSKMDIIWAAVVAVCFVLHPSKAETFKCTVSQNGDIMTFTILDGSRAPDVNPSDCDFEWNNGSNIRIADNSSHIPPVMERSLNSLTTSQCVEGIISKQHCHSKVTGFWIEYTANCTVTCTIKDLKDHGEPQKDLEEGQGGPSKICIAVGVIAVVVLAGLLCYKFRDYIWKTIGCSLFRGRYTKGKLESIQPGLPDV